MLWTPRRPLGCRIGYRSFSGPFTECGRSALGGTLCKAKKLKAVAVRSWSPEAWKVAGAAPLERVSVVGGVLEQTRDMGLNETLRSVTKKPFPDLKKSLAMFGIAVSRALKSNAVAIVAESAEGVLLLWGAGQGQPNRVEAIRDSVRPAGVENVRGHPRNFGRSGGRERCVLSFSGFGGAVATRRHSMGGSTGIKDADVVAAAEDRLEWNGHDRSEALQACLKPFPQQ